MSSAETVRIWRWPALLLVLVQPIIGLLYLGRAQLAALTFALQAAATLLAWLLPLHGPVPTPGMAALLLFIGFVPLGLVGHLLGLVALAKAWRHPVAPRRTWRRWPTLLGLAMLLAVSNPLVLWTPLASFNVPSGSMQPSLLVGDIFLTESPSRPGARALERGDIIVFPAPADPTQNYVKRLVGLGGDRIQLLDGVLHINGTAVRREPLGAADAEGNRRVRETLPGGRSYEVLEMTQGYGALRYTAEFLVPPGQLFVLGDNRDNSLDSRLPQVGFVPAESVIGSAIVVFWAQDRGRIGTLLP